MIEQLESQINLADGERDRRVLGRGEAAPGFQSTLLSQDFAEAPDVGHGSPRPAVLSYLWFLNFIKMFSSVGNVRRHQL